MRYTTNEKERYPTDVVNPLSEVIIFFRLIDVIVLKSNFKKLWISKKLYYCILIIKCQWKTKVCQHSVILITKKFRNEKTSTTMHNFHTRGIGIMNASLSMKPYDFSFPRCPHIVLQNKQPFRKLLEVIYQIGHYQIGQHKCGVWKLMKAMGNDRFLSEMWKQEMVRKNFGQYAS